jgi:hypothetical protein
LNSNALIGWRRRSDLVGLGLVFFVCSMVPILFIPFQPTRYTTVPLVGFVLVMTGAIHELIRWTPAPRRRLAEVGAATVALAVFGSGVGLLFGDVQDMQRQRASYTTLLNEIEAFGDEIPTDRPVVCLRLEQIDPLLRLNAEGSLGVHKLYFQRAVTPYGLADWAELFTFGRVGRGDEILIKIPPDEAPDGPYAVVAHLPGRFVLMDPRADHPLDEMAAWIRAGHHVSLIGPWSGRDL